MNDICLDLLKRLRENQPGVEDQIFLMIIGGMLQVWKMDKDLNFLDQASADVLWALISPLSQENLEVWVARIVSQKGGKFQDLLRDPIFVPKK